MSPRFFYVLINMLLNGERNEKVGIYLHGQSNSGKTYLTSGLFKHLQHLVGMTTNDNFPFQEVVNKKIVVGEEVAITNANADLWKALTSGQRTAVARKGHMHAYCKQRTWFLSVRIRNWDRTSFLRIRNLSKPACMYSKICKPALSFNTQTKSFIQKHSHRLNQ